MLMVESSEPEMTRSESNCRHVTTLRPWPWKEMWRGRTWGFIQLLRTTKCCLYRSLNVGFGGAGFERVDLGDLRVEMESRFPPGRMVVEDEDALACRADRRGLAI